MKSSKFSQSKFSQFHVQTENIDYDRLQFGFPDFCHLQRHFKVHHLQNFTQQIQKSPTHFENRTSVLPDPRTPNKPVNFEAPFDKFSHRFRARVPILLCAIRFLIAIVAFVHFIVILFTTNDNLVR